ncbi:hypothetical protein [Myxococcus xanthus]|uniref:hypothetical protein n=1 Tax=Myxococcus xanthus TaxID=34 RepID=UPI00112BFB6D|nr:hypothetical protein [Myxococcus xanthus]
MSSTSSHDISPLSTLWNFDAALDWTAMSKHLSWKPERWNPTTKTELELPFDLGDGAVSFAAGGALVQWRDGQWTRCINTKHRSNDLQRDEEGRLLVACNGGRALRGHPDALAVVKVPFETVSAVAALEGTRWVCAGLEGEVLLLDGETVVAELNTGGAIHAVLPLNAREALLFGDGIHLLTQKGQLKQEVPDVWLQSAVHFKEAVLAFGGGVGLTGKPTYAFRQKKKWKVTQLADLDGELLSLAVLGDAIYVPTGTGLFRLTETKPAQQVSDVPCTHVGIVGGKLIASGRGAAYVLKRRALIPL